jgi:hypothetical protein
MEPARRKEFIVLRSAGVVVLAVAVLNGCGAWLGKSQEKAKQSIVTIIDGSTEAVGDGWSPGRFGAWEIRSHPCGRRRPVRLRRGLV